MKKSNRQMAFDFREGHRRKEAALTYAQGAARDWLEEARRYARHHCHVHGKVTADDVVNNVPWPEEMNPNLRGALFKTPDFTRTGYTLSKRAEAHCNILGVWVLTEGRDR